MRECDLKVLSNKKKVVSHYLAIHQGAIFTTLYHYMSQYRVLLHGTPGMPYFWINTLLRVILIKGCVKNWYFLWTIQSYWLIMQWTTCSNNKMNSKYNVAWQLLLKLLLLTISISDIFSYCDSSEYEELADSILRKWPYLPKSEGLNYRNAKVSWHNCYLIDVKYGPTLTLQILRQFSSVIP